MLAHLNIGSAFRYSRNIVGGLTGFIFSLGNLFKVPFKGPGPAIFMGLLGLSTFIFKVRENHQTEDPDISIEDYKKNKIDSSTATIVTELTKEPQKIRIFRESKQHEETAISLTLDQLKDILNSTLDENLKSSKTCENIMGKYLQCTKVFLAQVGCHFMECLLEKTYDKPNLFNFKDFTADNIFIVMLSVLAVYNGYQSYKENHAAYEKISIDTISKKFVELSLRQASNNSIHCLR